MTELSFWGVLSSTTCFYVYRLLRAEMTKKLLWLSTEQQTAFQGTA